MNVLDSLMYLSSSQNEQIRSIGFSTLSNLANLSSQFKYIYNQIHKDLEIEMVEPPAKQTTYHEQLVNRLQRNKKRLFQQIKQTNLKKNYTGLFFLTKLSYGVIEVEIHNSIDQFIEFIEIFKKAIHKSSEEKRVEN